MNDTTKLPRWAQDHIKDLQRERDTAVRCLNEFQDAQTASSFYVSRLECTGESQGPTEKRHYIQTDRIHFVWGGNNFEISLPTHKPYHLPTLRSNTGRLVLHMNCANTVEFEAV